MFPNGTVVTPDGRTLIVAESRGRRLTAFDVEEDGSLASRRVWADLDGPPDGICLDAEGCIWVAVPGGVRAGSCAQCGGFARMLRGPERRTLFLLEAFAANPERIRGSGNGGIRTVEVDVPGADLP